MHLTFSHEELNKLDKDGKVPLTHPCLVYDPIDDITREVKLSFTDDGIMWVNENIQKDSQFACGTDPTKPGSDTTTVQVYNVYTDQFEERTKKMHTYFVDDTVMEKKTHTKGARNFDVEGHQWKTKESVPNYDWDCDVLWMGFTSSIRNLLTLGWKIQIVTNNVTKKKRLYVRHPEIKYVGRCDYDGNALVFKLEFLVPEKNQRTKPPLTYIEREVPVISEETVPMILEEIAKFQEENKPKRLNKKKLSSTEVLEFVRKTA